ncbi:SRPBCC family protein [Tsukamurella soli]|uniref:SRPBCC family protein n=1 Tax=Tsukamurella soli TaxID=644556 RepID=A0ABP8KGG8_9ACTN
MPDFEISRDINIAAPPSTVFGLIDDFHQWRHWSPWEGLDPNLHRDYSTDPAEGVGSWYEWSGNRKAGAGRMTITAAAPDETVDIELAFSKPFAATNRVRLTLEPDGAGTHVTWTMTGTTTGVMGVIHRVMPMDTITGRGFEKGLRQLKDRAEQR